MTAARTTAPPVIDAHAHVWSDVPHRYPFAPHDGLPPPSVDRTVPDLLHDSGDVHLHGLLLIQPRVYGYDHAYLHATAAAFPQLVRTAPLLNVARPSSAAELREVARHQHTSAFRVIALGERPANWLVGEEAQAVWRTAAQLDLPVGFLVDCPQLPLVRSIASAHPDLRVVVDHMARCSPQRQPEWQQTLLRLADRPNAYVKLSAVDGLSAHPYPYEDMWPLVRRLGEAFGADRLLWGSDWPHQRDHGPYSRACDVVRLALNDASPNELASIYSGTASRLFRFPAPATHKENGS